ncbi:MAG: hypothetical protein HRF40_13290 [Nitrososphaera sp.]
MSDSAIIPVIAGLAVGIAWIALFALAYKPVTALTDAEMIEKTKAAREVQLFLQKYPHAKITVDRLERGTEVTFAAEKRVTNIVTSQDEITEKRLIASVDPYGAEGAALRLECYHAERTVMSFDAVTAEQIDKFCF